MTESINGEYVWESYVTGPRWAAIGQALRKSVIEWRAAGHDITLEALSVDKGIVRETTYFTIVCAEKWVMDAFQRMFVKALKDY